MPGDSYLAWSINQWLYVFCSSWSSKHESDSKLEGFFPSELTSAHASTLTGLTTQPDYDIVPSISLLMWSCHLTNINQTFIMCRAFCWMLGSQNNQAIVSISEGFQVTRKEQSGSYFASQLNFWDSHHKQGMHVQFGYEWDHFSLEPWLRSAFLSVRAFLKWLTVPSIHTHTYSFVNHFALLNPWAAWNGRVLESTPQILSWTQHDLLLPIFPLALSNPNTALESSVHTWQKLGAD